MISQLVKEKLLETKLLMSHGRRNEIRKYLDTILVLQPKAISIITLQNYLCHMAGEMR